MFDGGDVAGLVILGRDDPGLVLELPLVLEVDVLAVGVGHAAAQGVEDGRPGAEVPLLDDGGVDVDVLVASHELPHLASKQTFNSDNIERIMEN